MLADSQFVGFIKTGIEMGGAADAAVGHAGRGGWRLHLLCRLTRHEFWPSPKTLQPTLLRNAGVGTPPHEGICAHCGR